MSIIKNYQASKGNCKVTFTYPSSAATGVKTVQILGDFNNWDTSKAPKMKAAKDELSAVIEMKSGRSYEFRYLLDGLKWDNDHQADAYVSSPFSGISNSVIVLEEVVELGSAAPKVIAKSKVASPKAKVETKAPAPKAKATGKVASPAAVASPAKVVKKVEITKKAVIKVTKDDLTKIEGIGPKIAEILTKAGIVTFSDLSNAKITSLKAVLEAAGPKFNVHDPATWSKQASLAAKGSWDALKKLQIELNAGKVAK